MSTSIIAPSASLSGHPSTYGPTAGQRVYSIPHIRRQIIRGMAPSSLANLLRTEKACFEEVVKELYYAVPFNATEYYMGNDPIRRPIYVNAIVEVNAKEIGFSPAMRQIPGWERFERDSVVDKYDPVTFNFVVPYLRLKLPSLRRLRFEASYPAGEYCIRSWEVTCDPASSAGTSDQSEAEYDGDGYVGELAGSIDFRAERSFYAIHEMDRSTLRAIEGPQSPKGSYDVRYRFNLEIQNHSGKPVPPHIVDKWSNAFRTIPDLDNLYTRLRVTNLPITIDDITSLYQRQISAGRSERLTEVTVNMLRPWQISSFAALASGASASLTSLNITGGAGCLQPSLGVSDLPAFIEVVRDNLPNLRTLAMSLDVASGAEAKCFKLLTPRSLEAGGTVKALTIGAWHPVGLEAEEQGKAKAKAKVIPFFNFIRVLSALCTPDAAISVDNPASLLALYGFASLAEKQDVYLQYLRRQPPHCRYHLATVDFAALGLSDLRQVLSLGYRQDGQPVFGSSGPPWNLEKTKTAEWAASLGSSPKHSGPGAPKTGLIAGLRSCRDLITRFDEISASAPAWEVLQLAEPLLETAEPLIAMLDRAREAFDVEWLRELVRVKKEAEVQRVKDGAV